MFAAAREVCSIASCAADCVCTVTGAVAAVAGSSLLVAVTVTEVALLTVGAVNRPFEEIVPALALQITEVCAVLAKLAVNCSLAPDGTTALAGKIIGKEIFELGALPAGCDPGMDEQPAVAIANTTSAKRPAFWSV